MELHSYNGRIMNWERNNFRFISHLLVIVHDHSTLPVLRGSSLTFTNYGLQRVHSGFGASGIPEFLEIKEIPLQDLKG